MLEPDINIFPPIVAPKSKMFRIQKRILFLTELNKIKIQKGQGPAFFSIKTTRTHENPKHTDFLTAI